MLGGLPCENWDSLAGKRKLVHKLSEMGMFRGEMSLLNLSRYVLEIFNLSFLMHGRAQVQ